MHATVLLFLLPTLQALAGEDFQLLKRHMFGPWLKEICRDRHVIPPRVEHGGADFEAGGVHGVIFWPSADEAPTFYAVTLPTKAEAMNAAGPEAEHAAEVDLEKIELHLRRDGQEVDVRVGPRRFREWSRVAEIARKIQESNPRGVRWSLRVDEQLTMKHVGAALDAMYQRGKGTLNVGYQTVPMREEDAGWREEMRAATSTWPMTEPPGELLIVLGEDAPYRRLSGLLTECGVAGNWRLTIAVVDGQRWSKLPLYLPRPEPGFEERQDEDQDTDKDGGL